MVFFQRGGREEMQVWTQTQGEEIYDEATGQRSECSQIFTSTIQPERQKKKKKKSARGGEVDQQPHKDSEGKVQDNREIKIYVDLGWIRWRGWIYFKVNVWQFRWNMVSLSNRRWKRTGEDERIKRQAAGRKRGLLRYLSPGTRGKTLKIPTNCQKMNRGAHHTACITAALSTLKNRTVILLTFKTSEAFVSSLRPLFSLSLTHLFHMCMFERHPDLNTVR